MKNLKDVILEKLKIDNNTLSSVSADFSEDCLYEIYDEDEYNYEKYGELYFDGNVLGLYREILHHNSVGAPIKRLFIIVSNGLYRELSDINKDGEPTLIKETLSKELKKVFDIAPHQIYVESYQSYVDSMKDALVDDWVATDEFIDWLHHFTRITGYEFYSYDVNFYKE